VTDALSIRPAPDGRRLFLDGLVDYAGLFPPANLDMAASVAEYRQARNAATGWIIDRFIIPASRLNELAAELTSTMTAGEPPWDISVILDTGGEPWLHSISSDVATATAFARELAPAVRFTMAEVKVPIDLLAADDPAHQVGEAATSVARLGAMPMFELPPAGDLRSLVGALVDARQSRQVVLGAKLRCGGLAAHDFPPPQQVADFISICGEFDVPFKATAGLHHPFRYEDPDDGFTHHGFVNIVTAAVMASSLDDSLLVELISDQDGANFDLAPSGLSWRGHSVTAEAVATGRAGLITSYGSCSVAEPLDDLAAMGVLP